MNYLIIGIFSSTIKNNILFGRDYDQKLFQRVIHASALEAVRQIIIIIFAYIS
jgi:ABC-type multidrug transport system fused ATPase/permease subunit